MASFPVEQLWLDWYGYNNLPVHLLGLFLATWSLAYMARDYMAIYCTLRQVCVAIVFYRPASMALLQP